MSCPTPASPPGPMAHHFNTSSPLPWKVPSPRILDALDKPVGIGEDPPSSPPKDDFSLPRQQLQEDPYHVFTNRQKWLVVYLVSAAGMFSPLSSNIYFPAIDTISYDLHASAALIAPTITVYMIIQGIAPSFWGPWSDACGRRVIFACTLGLYLLANLLLAFTGNYPMLLTLRGIQAAGSAATISIGTGVIADIALPSERGGFIGTNSGIRMIGQALGPVVGGLLNGWFGFRSIFWFLFVLSALVLSLILFVLPETHRGLAGNGTTPLHGIHKPFIYYILPPPKAWATNSATRKTPPLSFRKVLVPLTQLFEKDILALLIWGALVYTVWSMVTSTTTTVVVAEFRNVTELELGLCFLPNGVGCVLGSVLTGKLMDRNFKKVEKRYRRENNIPADQKIRGGSDFPFEKARLPPMPYLSGGLIVSVVLYGLSYELNDLTKFAFSNLLVSLILQFFISFTATAIFSINSAIIVDCFPSGGAGASAVNNLARCTIGAIGVSVAQPMIDLLKVRNTFVTLGALLLLFSPLIWVESKYGEQWRHARAQRLSEKEALATHLAKL